MPDHICKTCSKRGTDCCHLTDDAGQYKFGLSISDLQRISKATERAPREFADFGSISVPAKLRMEHAYPGIGRMFPHRVRISLKFDGPNRACHFWKPESGCALDMHTRPRFCTLFPAWYSRDGAVLPVALTTEAACYAVEKAQGHGRKTLAVLDTTLQRLGHFAQLSNAELAKHSSATVADLETAYSAVEPRP